MQGMPSSYNLTSGSIRGVDYRHDPEPGLHPRTFDEKVYDWQTSQAGKSWYGQGMTRQLEKQKDYRDAEKAAARQKVREAMQKALLEQSNKIASSRGRVVAPLNFGKYGAALNKEINRIDYYE